MDILVEVDPLLTKPDDVSGLRVALNLTNYIRRNWDKSLPELAIMLEDYNPVTIKVPTPRKINGMVKLLELSNYLNLGEIILKPPTSNIYSFLRAAAEYNVVLSWLVKDDSEIPIIPPPHRLSVTINVPLFKSLRNLMEFLLPNLGSIHFIYMHNVKDGKGGYPIMSGPIDYLKIVRILTALGWGGNLILSYSTEYIHNYRDDVNVLRTFIESAGSTVLDKGTMRMLNSIMRRLMGNSTGGHQHGD